MKLLSRIPYCASGRNVRLKWVKKKRRFVRNNKGSARWKRSRKNRRGSSLSCRYCIPAGSRHDSIMMTRLFDADIESEYRFVGDSDWRFATLFATTRPWSGGTLPRDSPFILNESVKGGSSCDHPNFVLFFFFDRNGSGSNRNARSFPMHSFFGVVIANV